MTRFYALYFHGLPEGMNVLLNIILIWHAITTIAFWGYIIFVFSKYMK